MVDDKAKIDNILCEIDDEQIASGAPILSVLVTFDDGTVSTAFWNSVKKHKLMRSNESEQECVARLRKEAFAHYGNIKM